MKNLKKSIVFCFVVCFMLCFSFSIVAAEQDIRVSATVDEGKAAENAPVIGTITVTHPIKDAIDPASFTIAGKPLSVEQIKTVPISSDLEVVIFQFQLPGQEKGLYVLPDIEVSIAGKKYHTVNTTYEVVTPQKASRSTPTRSAQPIQNQARHSIAQKSVQNVPGKLLLKAEIVSLPPTYPGQRVKMIYRFYFTGNIELTAESLPLLDAKGLEKVGDKVIRDYQENEWAVQEISQEYQAAAPGTFNFPASSAEGYTYNEDPVSKKRSYIEPKLYSEVTAMSLTVTPFPAVGKPSDFQGAIGVFTFTTSLLTSPKTEVESKMQLALNIFSREAVLATIPAPNIRNQPGIQGLFRLGDLPPVGTIKDNTKQFVIDLYPLSTSVTEIPSIAFSFFDPLANRYDTVHSDPIPIQVLPRTQKKLEEVIQPQQKPIVPEQTVQQPTKPATSGTTDIKPSDTIVNPEAIEIIGNEKLDETDTNSRFFGTWWVLWLIPVGIILLFVQSKLRQYLLTQNATNKNKQSRVLFDEAMQEKEETSKFFEKLEHSLMLKLKEKELISSSGVTADALANHGIEAEVKNFLSSIEELRFAKSTNVNLDVIKAQARQLFDQLEK
ncbi:MAG: BatD family protein [Parachlamydiaceae bacterium]|nr:BatD family protein [Parachlamydiaceae bacterium]